MCVKLLKNQLVVVLVWGSFSMLAQPVSIPSDLDTIVKVQGTEAKLLKSSNAGRQVIIEEMLKFPEQLANDIKRQSAINVMIKGSIPVDVYETMKDKSVLDIYDSIAKRLYQIHVSETDKSTAKNRLGKFFTAEVIYPLVQNFNAVSFLKFHQDHPSLFNWQELGKDIDTKLITDIVYDADKNIITTTASSEKMLNDVSGVDSSRKKFILKASAAFELLSGKVTLSFSYDFDGLKKASWVDNNPFANKDSLSLKKLRDFLKIK